MLPAPTTPFPLTIRPGTPGDVPFMDALQKTNGKALGWFPTKQFEGYVAMNGVLVAEAAGRAVGYVLSRDRYAGRDDVGAIYQLAVEPGRRRSLVGASLVKAVFERAAYGCRLFCCWCAQDLPANRFWQSLGFVPLAFRTGSRGKGRGARTHIFWQRRVRAGDEYPWWYPYQTRNGAIREDRLVFPIPPGVSWEEAKSVILPEDARAPALEDKATKRKAAARRPAAPALPPLSPGTAALHGKMALMLGGGRFKYVDRPGPKPVVSAPELAVVEKPKREPKKMLKHEEKALAFCRELRDRYLETVNADPRLLESAGQYEVAALPASAAEPVRVERLALPGAARLLPAA